MDASIWMLRALLSLSAQLLPPEHALCAHILPDLTQLAALHASRNAIAAPLPRSVTREVAFASTDSDISFADRRAAQYNEAVHALALGRGAALLPDEWPKVRIISHKLLLHFDIWLLPLLQAHKCAFV